MADRPKPDISAEALATTCSDSDLTRLSQHIVDWEDIAAALSITEAEEREIKENNPRDYQMQKYAMLRKWKAKAGDDATYNQLIRVFRKMTNMGLVEHVQEILIHPEESATASNVLACYQEFLQRSYCKARHPSLLLDQWPVMKNPAFVSIKLSLVKGNGNKCSRKNISLSDLFAKTKPQSRNTHQILLRGLPGSGKTTLTWHVSQLWAKKELFCQFSLFLTVPLRSQQVQQATCLADLIPHPDQEQRRAVALALSTNHGDGVCFWFDGWDEMSQIVQKKSFVASFIRQDAPQSSLPSCTIVVTSRSYSEFLNWLNIAKVDIDNLDQKQVAELVTKNTEGTGYNANELLTALESKAALSRFCSLPITVTILIHLFFTFGVNIPTTQTELFRCLILNLLLRNLQTRWDQPVKMLESFDSLSEFPSKCFAFLCKLAYDGVMQNKAVFRPSDIPNLPLPLATLGLMRINPRIEWFGIDEELIFIHSTIQEFLAAYHLSSLPSAQQIDDLNKIMESEHSPVVIFFGGLTKFSGTRELFPPRRNLYKVDWHNDWFFTLVESLYEANTPSLCHVITECNASLDCDINIQLQSRHNISFTPAQMVPLGYYIVHLCVKKVCLLSLFNCQYSKSTIKSFVKTIISEWKTLNPKPTKPNLLIVISDNYISHATEVISELIVNTDLLQSLRLFIHMSVLVYPWRTPTKFFHKPQEVILETIRQGPRRVKYKHVADRRLCLHSVMRPLIGALSRNSSMMELFLKFRFPSDYEMPSSALIAYSEYYMFLLLTCCPGLTQVVFKKFFQPYHPYHLFSLALRHNKTIEWFGLVENIPLMLTEPSLVPLAVGIGRNRCIKGMNLMDALSNDSLLCLLNSILRNGSLLGAMVIDIKPSLRAIKVLRILNICRERFEKPPLNICYRNLNENQDVVYNGFDETVRVRCPRPPDSWVISDNCTGLRSFVFSFDFPVLI